MGLLETFNSRNTKRRRRNLPLALRPELGFLRVLFTANAPGFWVSYETLQVDLVVPHTDTG